MMLLRRLVYYVDHKFCDSAYLLLFLARLNQNALNQNAFNQYWLNALAYKQYWLNVFYNANAFKIGLIKCVWIKSRAEILALGLNWMKHYNWVDLNQS